MAAVIVSTPTALNPAYNPIIFGLQLTDLGTDPESKSLVYKVIFTDANGVSIDATGLNELRPFSASQIINIDVSTDVQPFLNTAIPSLTGHSIPIALSDLLIWGKVKVKVYEKVTNNETCETTVTEAATSSDFFVLNSGVQGYQTNYQSFDTPQVLDNRPRKYTIDRNAYDYMWIWGQTTVTYTNNLGASTTITAANQVNIITMSAFGVNRSVLKWMDVRLNSVEGGITYRVHFKDYCETNILETVNVMFLNPLGGRCLISFDRVNSLGFTSSSNVISRYKKQLPSPTSNNYLTPANSAGNTIFKKSNRENVSLVYEELKDTASHLEFFKAFLGSSGYHIISRTIGNLNQLYHSKFIIEDGTVAYYQDEERATIEVRGYFANNYITQKSDH